MKLTGPGMPGEKAPAMMLNVSAKSTEASHAVLRSVTSLRWLLSSHAHT